MHLVKNNQSDVWTPSGYKAWENKDQLQDETFDGVLAIHDPIWRSIVTRYDKESKSPLIVAGYHAIPFAIELSQWGYPIIYITDTYQGVLKARKDCEIHAGEFQHMLWMDFKRNIPHARILLCQENLDTHLQRDIRRFLLTWLRRVREVLYISKNPQMVRSALHGQFQYSMEQYEQGVYALFRITHHES